MNNTNKIQVFQNEAFGQVRIITKDGEPWFVGKETAEKLGYSNSRKALADHVKDNHKNTVTIRDGIQGGEKPQHDYHQRIRAVQPDFLQQAPPPQSASNTG